MQSGSPGRFGIWTLSPPINSISRFTVCGAPAPRFQVSPVNGVSAAARKAEATSDALDEVATLGSVADHGEGLACQLLTEEHTEHGAVGARGADARAIGVEDADRIDGEAIDAVPVQRGLLTLKFRQRIGILRHDRMVFSRRRGGKPVAGRRGRIDSLSTAAARAASRTCTVPWTLTDIYSLGRSIEGTMSPMPAKWKTKRAPLKGAESGANARISSRSRVRSRLPPWCARFRFASAGQIVDHADFEAALQQQIDHVTADEARAPGDDRDRRSFIAALSAFKVRTLK